MANLKLIEEVPYEGIEESYPPVPRNLAELALDAVWVLRDQVERNQRELRDQKSAYDAELTRRFRAAHEGMEDGEGGSRQIAGEEILVTLTWDRDYATVDDEAVRLAESRLLTPVEYSQLVKYEPKVNGTVFNSLMRRGGELADVLGRLRIMRRASPKFEAKARR